MYASRFMFVFLGAGPCMHQQGPRRKYVPRHQGSLLAVGRCLLTDAAHMCGVAPVMPSEAHVSG
jgi:hypothetical protein